MPMRRVILLPCLLATALLSPVLALSFGLVMLSGAPPVALWASGGSLLAAAAYVASRPPPPPDR